MLPVHQPIEGFIKLAIFDQAELEFEGEGAGGRLILEGAGASELGAWKKDACDDHGNHQIALAAGARRDEAVEAKLAESAKNKSDMTMRQGTNDFPRLIREGGFAAQTLANDFDEIVRQVGDVSESLVLDFTIFAEGAAEEMGDVSLAFVRPLCSGYMNRT
jgi:hypothetical protein